MSIESGMVHLVDFNDIVEKDLKPSRFDVGFASWDYNIDGTTTRVE